MFLTHAELTARITDTKEFHALLEPFDPAPAENINRRFMTLNITFAEKYAHGKDSVAYDAFEDHLERMVDFMSNGNYTMSKRTLYNGLVVIVVNALTLSFDTDKLKSTLTEIMKDLPHATLLADVRHPSFYVNLIQ